MERSVRENRQTILKLMSSVLVAQKETNFFLPKIEQNINCTIHSTNDFAAVALQLITSPRLTATEYFLQTVLLSDDAL